MTEHEFFKLLNEVYQEAKKEAEGKVFLIKPEALARTAAIRRAAQSSCMDYSESFDPVLSAIDIEFSSYVFDSAAHDMRTLLLAPDFFVIDALEDGKLRIQARILDAGIELQGGEIFS